MALVQDLTRLSGVLLSLTASASRTAGQNQRFTRRVLIPLAAFQAQASNDPRVSTVSPNDPRLTRVAPDDPRLSRPLPKDPRVIRISADDPRLSRPLANDPRVTRVSANDPRLLDIAGLDLTFLDRARRVSR